MGMTMTEKILARHAGAPKYRQRPFGIAGGFGAG